MSCCAIGVITISVEGERAVRDGDVRKVLLSRLGSLHQNDSDTIIVEEMGIWAGTARIDVAVINGELTGFELKSDSDTLLRLPFQAEIYGLVFDKVYLVASRKHLKNAQKIIPRWWGKLAIEPTEDGTLDLVERRPARENPKVSAEILAKLLWRSEALALLELHGLATGHKSKSAPALHQRLAQQLDITSLKNGVRSALKNRPNWLGKIDPDALNMPVDAVPDPCFQ